MTTSGESPVFIVGCPRSGTTLMYHMLLSSGGFAVYRTEFRLFDLILPRFRELKRRRDRAALLDVWLSSHLHQRSGLERERVQQILLEESHSGVDFFRRVMKEIAKTQGMRRWAECTPMNALFMPRIRHEFPDALFVHMIRDGRDVAASLSRTGWIKPFRWERGADRSLVASALYWDWLVGRALRDAPAVRPNYLEVKFEDLVRSPRETLATVGHFLGHQLRYEEIVEQGIGSVSRPDSSFRDREEDVDPVGRWRRRLSQDSVERLDDLIGTRLAALRYPTARRDASPRLRYAVLTRRLYRMQFDIKHFLKHRTPLGSKLVDIADLVEAPGPAVHV